MKTKIHLHKMLSIAFKLFLVTLLIFQASVVFSQNEDSVKTFLKSDTKVIQVIAPETKINTIQGDIGMLIGVYGGALINRSFMIGACIGVNLGHPRVNYGYVGGIIQYIFNPEQMVHFSSQLVVACGSAKDYESTKSNVFDNFWNISGTSFYLAEPGVNIEMNLNQKTILFAGVSYRYVYGLNENSEHVSITHVNNDEMSGANLSLGIKFRR